MSYASYVQCDGPNCEMTTNDMAKSGWFTVSKKHLRFPRLRKSAHCCSMTCLMRSANELEIEALIATGEGN